MAEHTKEPWQLYEERVIHKHDDRIASVDMPDQFICPGRSEKECRANARRICAAVNACQGISTEALKQGAVAKLLAACKGTAYFAQCPHHAMSNSFGCIRCSAYLEAQEAIALAIGKEPSPC